MKKLIIIFLLLLTITAVGLEYNVEDVYNNLTKRITGNKDDIMKIAKLLANYQYIINTKPDSMITPQTIKVLPDYTIKLSANRKIILTWPHPESKTNIIFSLELITTDKITSIKKKYNKWELRLLTGISLSEEILLANIGLGIKTPRLLNMSIVSGITYGYDKNIFGIIGLGYSLSYGIELLLAYQINFNNIEQLNSGLLLGFSINIF